MNKFSVLVQSFLQKLSRYFKKIRYMAGIIRKSCNLMSTLKKHEIISFQRMNCKYALGYHMVHPFGRLPIQKSKMGVIK